MENLTPCRSVNVAFYYDMPVEEDVVLRGKLILVENEDDTPPPKEEEQTLFLKLDEPNNSRLWLALGIEPNTILAALTEQLNDPLPVPDEPTLKLRDRVLNYLLNRFRYAEPICYTSEIDPDQTEDEPIYRFIPPYGFFRAVITKDKGGNERVSFERCKNVIVELQKESPPISPSPCYISL